jgi:hypothetical protein
MKKLTLLLLMMATGLFMVAQNAALKQGLPEEHATSFQSYDSKPLQHAVVGQSPITKPMVYKSTDAVSIIDIGTSANAYGVANGGKSNLMVNNDLNVISCIHRMGGALDPGGYSGDLGYDVSKDGGMTWSVMTETYTAYQNAGGLYYLDAARYPQHGIYNPVGNTDPDNAYIAYAAATTGFSNDSWGGFCWGRGSIGDPTDTTYNFINIPGAVTGIYRYVPQGMTVAKGGDFWVADGNIQWTSPTTSIYMGSLILTRGIWNEDVMDFDAEFILLDMTGPADARPADYKVEFSPDGQIGYVMALMDIGEVPVSSGQSYYPVLFRTEDAGLNWSDPIPVALAGEDGLPGILNFLSDAEIAELYDPPLPDREQIPFTTSFDADISVDYNGNPHIAAVVGVSGSDPYSIASGRSAVSGYLFAGTFLISSDNMGEEGSWTARLLGRPSNFRGNFGELSEDNRVQIARDKWGTKMFVGWLDTDTTVSTENNSPDIWCRGYDVVNHGLTADPVGNPLPTNVTYGSEATFGAYFFGMANEAFDDGAGTYTIPFFYQEMSLDPGQQVQYKYIQDFKFEIGVGIDEPMVQLANMEVSQVMPNPATATARLAITLSEPASVSGEISNMMGQQVSTLPARRLQAGSNELTLDVSGLSAGIYFCTLTTGTESVTRKMIVK